MAEQRMRAEQCTLLLFFSSRRRHTRCGRDWSSDVCSSDLETFADGAVLRARAVLVPEAVGERLGRPQGLPVLERDERDAVALLRQRRPVPRAVERDERAAAVAGGGLRARVEHESIWRPVRGECDGRLVLVSATIDLPPVAAVLRREHEATQLDVVIAVGPAEVVAFVQREQLLGRLL